MRRPLALLVVLAVTALGLAPTAAAGEPRGERVYHGDDATPGQVPGMALVLDDQVGAVCGGTLVTPTQVLTAAHCLFGGGNLFVDLGITDLAEFPSSDLHSVVDVQVHPAYSGDLPFDVALLTLDSASVATPVRVAGSHEDGLWLEGTAATVAGWGDTETGPASTLQVAEVPIVACSFDDAVLCAGDGSPAVCSGDSGGPLLVPGGEGEPVLVGVVTGGAASCATPGFPDLYAKVGHPSIRDSWLEPLLDHSPDPDPEDLLGPRASSKAPTGTGVKRSASAKAVLTEKAGPASVSPFSVRLERMTSSGPVRVTDVVVSLLDDGRTVRLDPYGSSDRRLARKARYRVTVTTFVEDLAGNAFDQDRSRDGDQPLRWSFTTGRR